MNTIRRLMLLVFYVAFVVAAAAALLFAEVALERWLRNPQSLED